MKTNPNSSNPGSLEQRIEEKIKGIKAIENDFPGVIIFHNIVDMHVLYMSQWGRNWLGVSLDDLHLMGKEYFDLYFNPEDSKDYFPKVIGLLERNIEDEIVSFFQQVRRSPQHEWTWFASCAKVVVRNDDNQPIITQTTAIPIDDKHFFASKAQRLLEENSFLKRNTHIFNGLTRREKEILRLLAMGQSAAQIADEMHISEMTAATHRRNIKNKLNAQNNYDITRFAQAFDLI